MNLPKLIVRDVMKFPECGHGNNAKDFERLGTYESLGLFK